MSEDNSSPAVKRYLADKQKAKAEGEEFKVNIEKWTKLRDDEFLEIARFLFTWRNQLKNQGDTSVFLDDRNLSEGEFSVKVQGNWLCKVKYGELKGNPTIVLSCGGVRSIHAIAMEGTDDHPFHWLEAKNGSVEEHGRNFGDSEKLAEIIMRETVENKLFT